MDEPGIHRGEPVAAANPLGALGGFARRRGGVVLAVLTALALSGYLLGPRLRVDTDPASFFRENDPVLADFDDFADDFGLSDILIVVIRGDGEELAKRVTKLRRRLLATPYFTEIEARRAPGNGGLTALVAFPAESSIDQEFSRAMLAEVRRQAALLGVAAELTGPPVFAEEAPASIGRDIVRTGLLAALLVLAILILLFRDPLLLVAASPPLALGILGCMLFAGAVFGGINVLVAALPSSLIGIGIDFALHLRSARLEEPAADPVTGWRRVYSRTGPPLLVGTLTTMAAFLALLFAAARALPRMGIAGALGTALIFAFTLLTVPVLLDWRDRLGRCRRPVSCEWLGVLAHFAVRRRRWVIAGFAAVTAPLLLFALRLEISSDPETYDPDLPSRRVYHEVAETLGIITTPVLVAAENLAAEARLYDRIGDLVGPDRPFNRVDCITASIDALPLPGRIGRLFLGWPELVRMHPTAGRLLGRDGRSCLILYPGFDPYTGNGLARIAAAVQTVRDRGGADIARLSGMPVVYGRMLDLVRGDMLRTGAAAALIVILVLALLVRRPRHVLAALLPLLGGVTWMFGCLHLAGRQITAFNVISMPLVVGLGVDYGVHIVYRLRHSNVEETMATAGRAILAASLTTAAAMFALCLAENPAAVGMGLAGGIGILACLVWSLVLLPAVFVTESSHQTELPRPDRPAAGLDE